MTGAKSFDTPLRAPHDRAGCQAALSSSAVSRSLRTALAHSRGSDGGELRPQASDDEEPTFEERVDCDTGVHVLSNSPVPW